jgi:hydroxymethylbilane synthase
MTVSSASRTIRIGSRKSQLALVQTYWVQEQLQKHHPGRQFEVETMSTQGDKILDVALAKIGDKGLFTKELEVGMIEKSIDLAVHSLKDLPTLLPEGLILGCVTERVDPADALVVNEKNKDKQLDTLPCVGWHSCATTSPISPLKTYAETSIPDSLNSTRESTTQLF